MNDFHQGNNSKMMKRMTLQVSAISSLMPTHSILHIMLTR